MKKVIRSLVVAGLMAFSTLVTFTVISSTGCSSVDRGSTFAVVAEKDLRASFRLVDAFLLWESEHRDVVGVGVREFANELRDGYPKMLSDASAALEQYKLDRSQESKGVAIRMLAALASVSNDVIRHAPKHVVDASINPKYREE